MGTSPKVIVWGTGETKLSRFNAITLFVSVLALGQDAYRELKLNITSNTRIAAAECGGREASRRLI